MNNLRVSLEFTSFNKAFSIHTLFFNRMLKMERMMNKHTVDKVQFYIIYNNLDFFKES